MEKKKCHSPISARTQRIKRHIGADELLRWTGFGVDRGIGRIGRRRDESMTARTLVFVTDVSADTRLILFLHVRYGA